MGTVPTRYVEDALRTYYLQWLAGLATVADSELDAYIMEFEHKATEIINREGTRVARRGANAGFPAPRVIPMDVDASYVFDDVRRLAVQAGIGAGMQSRDVARQMFKQGMQGKFYELERFARTETTNAYWQHQWNQVEDLDLVMVWSAESSKRTCPYCLAKDGLVVKDKRIRDHPNGRCTLLPKMPDSVPLRGKTRDPMWTRNHRHKDNPPDSDHPMRHPLRFDLDTMLVSDNATANAVKGMVSQGWSPAEALSYIRAYPGRDVALTREQTSQVYRRLEQYAQELYEGLTPLNDGSTLYRGGNPGPTGLDSWTTHDGVARLYYTRNRIKGELYDSQHFYEMKAPKGVLAYDLKSKNPHQTEMLVLGSPRVTESSGGGKRGVLDGPTPLITATDAIKSLDKYLRQTHKK